ncbi:MAG: ABC transporter permease [archaeon]|nr:ABC transporter permease [archaeon]
MINIDLNYDEYNKVHRIIRGTLVTVSSLVIFVLVWNDISLLVGKSAIPSPVKTLDALKYLLFNEDGVTQSTIWHHMLVSLERFILGLSIAFVISVTLGLIIGSFKTLDDFTKPVIEILRPIAPMAWAPILIFAIGYKWGPIAVVFVGVFFPLLTNTIFGVKSIDSKLIDAARTLGASKIQIFTKVMLPCTVPYIMNGLRIGSGIGWMCIVASELYAAACGGIGYFVGINASIGLWSNVYVGIVVIAALGTMTTGLFDLIYKFVSEGMGMK